MTDYDYDYAVRMFDHWIEPAKVSSAAEADALRAYRRLLADAEFRDALVTFLAVGPCNDFIKAEVEQRYREETPSAAR